MIDVHIVKHTNSVSIDGKNFINLFEKPKLSVVMDSTYRSILKHALILNS